MCIAELLLDFFWGHAGGRGRVSGEGASDARHDPGAHDTAHHAPARQLPRHHLWRPGALSNHPSLPPFCCTTRVMLDGLPLYPSSTLGSSQPFFCPCYFIFCQCCVKLTSTLAFFSCVESPRDWACPVQDTYVVFVYPYRSHSQLARSL